MNWPGLSKGVTGAEAEIAALKSIFRCWCRSVTNPLPNFSRRRGPKPEIREQVDDAIREGRKRRVKTLKGTNGPLKRL